MTPSREAEIREAAITTRMTKSWYIQAVRDLLEALDAQISWVKLALDESQALRVSLVEKGIKLS